MMGFRAVRTFRKEPQKRNWKWPKLILPETEHLRRKLTDEQLKAIKEVLDRNQDVF